MSVRMTWGVNSNRGKLVVVAVPGTPLLRPRPTRRLRQLKLMPPRKRQPSRRSYPRESIKTPNPRAQRLMKGKMSFVSPSFIFLNSGLLFTAPILRLLQAGFRTLVVLGNAFAILGLVLFSQSGIPACAGAFLDVCSSSPYLDLLLGSS